LAIFSLFFEAPMRAMDFGWQSDSIDLIEQRLDCVSFTTFRSTST
jgi:hypothetical protein